MKITEHSQKTFIFICLRILTKKYNILKNSFFFSSKYDISKTISKSMTFFKTFNSSVKIVYSNDNFLFDSSLLYGFENIF